MISIKDLSKKYADKTIFNKINLEIPANKLTFVFGESGIGKSTLINLIAGFTDKDEGEIRFFKEGKEEKNPLIDVVFQDFNLIENLSVKNNILIGNNIIKREFDQVLLEKSANFLNIKNEKLNQQVKDLSGGEKQRVAILRAFSRNSDFILLDEPTGNLDEENAVAVFESLKKLSKNKTVLVVSHNLELAKLYADQIVHIENGAIEVEIFDKKEKNQEKESENSTFDTKTSKKATNFLSKFNTGFLLVFADLRTKIITFILLILTFFIFIGSSVLLTALNISAKNLDLNRVQQFNIDSIGINRPILRIPFSKEDEQELLKNNPKIKRLLPIYTGVNNLTFFQNSKIAYNNLIAPIDESDFFKNRIYSKEIEGNFIKNENEIIISEDVINEFKIKNPLGKKIPIVYYDEKEQKNKKNNNYNINQFSNIEATIVGINHKKEDTKYALSYLHHNLIRTIIEKEYVKKHSSNPFSSISWINKNYKKIRIEELGLSESGGENTISEFYYENQPEINKLKLIKGEFPKNYGEIAISSNIIFNKKHSEELMGEFLESNTSLPFQNLVFKVVGVFKTKEKIDIVDGKTTGVVVFNHQVKEFEKKLRPNSIQLFFSNDDLYQNMKNFEKNNPHFLITGGPERILGLLINAQIILQLILFGVLIIFSIIFFIFIGFFARNLSWSKRKTVAILKSLGAKTKNILFYHWLDLLILSFVVLFLGFVFIVPIVPEIYKGISHQDFAQPSYGQITMVFSIIWAIMFLILTLIYVVSSLWTYRKTVVKLLKN
ncbi:ATP-binding cassette domain-containing protein [Mesomycoplasma hyopneumoniae]|uniref:ATP-binding cassette domain-containing protein n=1 Tax=Mesomycoplasma hyopneumoniae TaxID=2099 RepID=UPI0038778F78